MSGRNRRQERSAEQARRARKFRGRVGFIAGARGACAALEIRAHLSYPATRSAPDIAEMKDELEQQIEGAESSDDVIQGIKYTMRMRATLIVSSTLFEMLILMLIILNGVLLGVQTYEKFGPVTNQALDATQRVRARSREGPRVCATE